MKSSGIFIGTSGWSYKHWTEIFYPKGLKPDKYLEYYITKFTCVELNSSFYNLPLKTTITRWMDRTPETFKFCPKLSRFITHQSKLVNIEGALKKYFDVFDGLKKRLGPVLVQLPPDLYFDKALISNFLELLKIHLSSFQFAFEVRHKSWITDTFFDLLSQQGIAFVIADSGNRFPYYETVTADFVYLRFHGPRQLYASDYSESDLKLYAEKILRWMNEGKEIWAFFNNDYYGFAVKNAEELRESVLPGYMLNH